MLACAAEFFNFIQISLEGVKFCRLVLEHGSDEVEFPQEVIDGYNRRVIYIKQKSPVSAFEIAEKMKIFGDIYVVKDSATACFVEFQYIIVPEAEAGEPDDLMRMSSGHSGAMDH